MTPLLDVILILLFAFMINMTNAVKEQETSAGANVERVEQLQKQLDTQTDKAEILESQKEAYEDTIQAYLEELEQLKEEKNRWMGDIDPQLQELLDQGVLKGVVDTSELSDQLQKYEAIGKKYVFIDVELRTSESKIYINSEETGAYILENEINTPTSKDAKKVALEDLVTSYLEGRQGGYTFALISLKEDGQVKRAQYNLMWDAIKKIQENKGSEKIFITQIQAWIYEK